MNLLDILILACLVFLIVRGIFRGFVREVGSLAGIILGIWAACVHHPQVTAFLAHFFPDWKYLSLLSVVVLLVAVLGLCNVTAWLLHKFLTKVFLGWADRSLGAGLAVLKGVVIIYFAIVVTTFFVPSSASVLAESTLAPVIVRSYQAMTGAFSPGAYADLKKKFTGQKEGFGRSLDKGKADAKTRHD